MTYMTYNTTIGIIGFGFVGKAAYELGRLFKVNVYDPGVKEVSSKESITKAYTSDFVICCVPTPQGNDGSVDLSILEGSINLWDSFNCDNIFVIKSTIPTGTVDTFCEKFKTKKIIHNPEFLTEKTHILDFLNPTDIVIGGDIETCRKLSEVYEKFYKTNESKIPISICSAKEAELTKTIRNSFYATKIIFMNEVYELATKLGIDYHAFEKILTNYGRHPWWGERHTQVPGPDGSFGFGGKCFPKDSAGLLALAKSIEVDLSVLEAAVIKNKTIR